MIFVMRGSRNEVARVVVFLQRRSYKYTFIEFGRYVRNSEQAFSAILR